LKATLSLHCRVAPRPPCSPLLSYTTLFRSLMQWHEFLEKHPHAVSILISKLANSYYSVSVASSLPRSGSKNAHITKWSNYGYGTDRKSTRLNSSHVKTSYAVFCSKKKTGAG